MIFRNRPKKQIQMIPKKTKLELCQNYAKIMADYEAASLTMTDPWFSVTGQTKVTNNTKEN